MLDNLLQITGGWNGRMTGYLVYVGLTVGVLLILTGLKQLLTRYESQSEVRSRRMRMIAKGQSGEERLALLKPPSRARGLNMLPFVGDLPKTIRQAGFTISAGTFLACCTAAFAITAFSAAMFTEPVAALGIAVLAGFAAPLAWLRVRARQQQEKLVAQLPDALDMMARGLKVGHPLNNSIGIVAQEMQDPAGTEFGIIYDQVTYGEDLPEAVQEFAQRSGLEDVNYLSASIGIQHGTGSDLAGMLETLAQVIRGRIAMRRKIAALSSEGRLTAWLLSSLPFVIYGSVTVMTPGYYSEVADDPLYVPMMAAVAIFTLLNAIVLKKLVNFRI